MRYNSAQKAQQALEELTKDGPLEERLEDAWIHLVMVGRRDYAEDCQEIVNAFESGEKASRSGDHASLARAIQEMIQHIFMEEGANSVREKFTPDPN